MPNWALTEITAEGEENNFADEFMESFEAGKSPLMDKNASKLSGRFTPHELGWFSQPDGRVVWYAKKISQSTVQFKSKWGTAYEKVDFAKMTTEGDGRRLKLRLREPLQKRYLHMVSKNGKAKKLKIDMNDPFFADEDEVEEEEETLPPGTIRVTINSMADIEEMMKKVLEQVQKM